MGELIQEPPSSGDKNDEKSEEVPPPNSGDNPKEEGSQNGEKQEENKDEGGKDGGKVEAPITETPAPAKKRFKKIGVNVMKNVHAYSKEEINGFIEAEANMAQQDRIIQETGDARNALESYIYEMRDKVSDYGVLKDYASEPEKTKIGKDLEDAENWLYDEGFDCTKAVYEERLKMLLEDGNKVIFRHEEVQKRSDAEETCKK